MGWLEVISLGRPAALPASCSSHGRRGRGEMPRANAVVHLEAAARASPARARARISARHPSLSVAD